MFVKSVHGAKSVLNKDYIDEHQVLERYLAEQLSDQERDEFENYYAENPEILRDLQAVAGIKTGAALLRQSGELKALTTARSAPRWRTGLALAASVLIAVVASNYWLRSGTSHPVVLAGDLGAFESRLSIAATYQVQRTRSDVDAMVTLPQGSQAIKLRIRPIFESPPARFKVELLSIATNSDARTSLASAEKLGLDADGFIIVYLDSRQIRPGSYELRVAADAAGANLASNEFLIEVSPATRPRP